jgi:hypothetical protein
MLPDGLRPQTWNVITQHPGLYARHQFLASRPVCKTPIPSILIRQLPRRLLNVSLSDDHAGLENETVLLEIEEIPS